MLKKVVEVFWDSIRKGKASGFHFIFQEIECDVLIKEEACTDQEKKPSHHAADHSRQECTEMTAWWGGKVRTMEIQGPEQIKIVIKYPGVVSGQGWARFTIVASSNSIPLEGMCFLYAGNKIIEDS